METLAINYRAGLTHQNDVVVKGSTFQSLIRNLKKMGGIDCRKTHTKQTIFSEFREGAWGVFFWNKTTGALDAWIEWDNK